MTTERRAAVAGSVVLAVFAAMLVVNVKWVASNWSRLAPMRAGESAPLFSLPRIGGSGRVESDAFDLEQVQGRVVVLDFWATWCGPCLAAMPALEQLETRYRDAGLTVVSINTEGAGLAAKARTIIDVRAPSLELLSDDGTVSDLYRVDVIPHIVVIDRSGRVRRVHRGVPSGGANALAGELGAIVDGLLRDR